MTHRDPVTVTRLLTALDDLAAYLRHRITEEREVLARQRDKHDTLRAWLEARRDAVKKE